MYTHTILPVVYCIWNKDGEYKFSAGSEWRWETLLSCMNYMQIKHKVDMLGSVMMAEKSDPLGQP